MNNSSTTITYSSEVNHIAKKLLVQTVEYATGRKKLERIYRFALEAIRQGESIWSAALQALQIHLEYDTNRIKAIPATGPLIFVANHPYGVLDGLVLCHLASQTRQNFRIFIINALCFDDKIAPYVLPIDFAGDEQAILNNLESMRNAIQTLRDDGALIIFPAGGISTAITPFGHSLLQKSCAMSVDRDPERCDRSIPMMA